MCFEITRAGPLRAVVGWWDARLTDNVTLGTGPGQATHWGQYLFPLPSTDVEVGDTLDLELWFDWDVKNWRWEGTVAREGTELVSFELEAEQRLGERNAPPAEGPADDKDAWSLLGADAFEAGRYRDAAKAFSRAASALRPSDADAPEVFENLGIAYVHTGELPGAVRALLRALDGNPTSREQSCRLLINALRVMGRGAEAERYLAAYREAFGEHPDWG